MKKLDLGVYGTDYYGLVPNIYVMLTSEKMEEIKDIQIGDEVEIVDDLENFLIKITNKSLNSLTFDSHNQYSHESIKNPLDEIVEYAKYSSVK